MNSNSRPTIWEEMQARGYSRRDFLKFCAFISAAVGIQSSAIGQVEKALESKPRLPVV